MPERAQRIDARGAPRGNQRRENHAAKHERKRTAE
jgi:hypothetical protein